MVFSVIENAVLTTSKIITGLVAGESYFFKIEARNDAHYSSPTAAIEVLCASIPDVP